MHAKHHNLAVNVLVDVDPGQTRTGFKASEALDGAKYIASLSHLRLRGVQCYAGHLQHIESFKERRELSLAAMGDGKKVLDDLIANKLVDAKNCIYTGSGTGTHDIDTEVEGLTDMQVGSYVVMDSEYINIGSRDDEKKFSAKFRTAPLTVLTTVISNNHFPSRLTIDGGLKAIYKDGGIPEIVYPKDFQHFSYYWAGDEHGFLVQTGENEKLKRETTLGRKVELTVSHCDPTINLHDFFFVTQNNLVVDIWPIDMRGKCQ